MLSFVDMNWLLLQISAVFSLSVLVCLFTKTFGSFSGET